MNVPYDALFQNCIIGSTPPNRKVARASDKQSFNRHLLIHWLNQIQNNFTELPHNTLYQNYTNGSARLNKIPAGTPDKKYL